MSRWLKLLLAVGAFEGIQSLRRFSERKRVFTQAKARAAALRRPLLVIGDPDTGAHTMWLRAYDCGDVCLDMTGCPKCAKGLAVTLGEQPIPLPANSHVVYISCVMELVDRLNPAWQEVLRVAGGEANVFMTPIGTFSLTSFFYPGVKWRIAQDGDRFTARRLK